LDCQLMGLENMHTKNIFLPGMCLFAFLSGCSTTEQREQATTQPNILFIAIDDLNDWLGCMDGHPNAQTPHMDKLAAEGVLFTNAHCQAPLCGPSRASMMSGMRPSSTGIYGMIDDNLIRTDNPATEDVVFLPEFLKMHGYYTMGIGKLFHEHAPDNQFDESGGRYRGFGPSPKKKFVWHGDGGPGYGRTSTDWGPYPEYDSLMPDHQSAEWAIERLNREYDQPFFLGVGFLRPHAPWYVPQHWFDLYNVDELAMPPYKADDLADVPPVALELNDLPMMPTTDWAIETDNWKDIVHAYLACVSFVDYQVGKIIDALKDSPHAENTIVVVWSDHGYRLGQKGTFAKHSLWEEATKAPLMFYGPGIKSGQVVSEAVEMLSIYPTLLELCGLPEHGKNEGVTLVPFLKGQPVKKDHVAITTHGKDNHSVKFRNYRYTRYEDGGEELYDHTKDPNEWNNLAENPDYNRIKQQLMEHLPKVNLPWAEHSSYSFQPYFVNQKARGKTVGSAVE
jgi:iduronate 2-sulfatase